MRTCFHKTALALVTLLASPLSVAHAATVFDFEAGFTSGQTSFSAGDLSVTLGGSLVVTEFPTFGSGEGDWFIDSGFGTPVSGSAGSISVSTTGIAGFRLWGMDLWTSNDGGGTYASGDLTLTGTLAGGGTFSRTLTVTPRGNGGLDWDTSNDLSAFSGLVLTALEISLGTGIDYVAVDNLAVESVPAVPEPGTLLLTALPLGGFFLRRRVSH